MTGLHALCEQARHATCICGATPDKPCDCAPAGVHLARFAHAERAGYIPAAEFASVIADADVFTGTTVVRDVTS